MEKTDAQPPHPDSALPSYAIASTKGFTKVPSNVQGFSYDLARGTAMGLRGDFQRRRCRLVDSSRQGRWWDAGMGYKWLVLRGSNKSHVPSKTLGSSSCICVNGLEYSICVPAVTRCLYTLPRHSLHRSGHNSDFS